MECIEFDVTGTLDSLARYGLLHRLQHTAGRRGVQVRGFALGDRIRLLLAGDEDSIAGTVAFTKMGTIQAEAHRDRTVYFGPTKRTVVWDPARALVQLHQVREGCPLADPWTSHRDLLGFRVASFFDPSPWRLDPRWVHVKAGGLPLPQQPERDRRPLGELLRTAGSVLGVVPANRACFGLFTHLASALGWRQEAIAAALMLTPRRIRQLKAVHEPRLHTALLCAADERLRAP